MPYNHNVLGVSCMTTSEFWKSESEREGIDASDLMEDFYQSLAQEEKDSANQILQNKDQVLEMLKQYYEADPDTIEFLPVEVLEVRDAVVRISSRSNSTSFICRVNCNDSKVRWLKYTETHYSGSYMDPPDFDCSCEEINSLE